jgi:hypothetical protein
MTTKYLIGVVVVLAARSKEADVRLRAKETVRIRVEMLRRDFTKGVTFTSAL